MGDFFEFEEELQEMLINYDAAKVQNVLKKAEVEFENEILVKEYIERYKKYIEIGIANEGFYAIGYRLEYIMTHLERANIYYLKALENGESRTRVLKRLIPLMYRIGNVEEGINILKECLKQKENVRWTVSNLIRFYFDLDRDEELFSLLKETIENDDNKLGLIALISKMYIECGEYEKAEIFIEMSAKFDESLYRKLKVYMLVQKKKFKEAKNIINDEELQSLLLYVRNKEKEYSNNLKEVKDSIVILLLEGDVDKAIGVAKDCRNMLKDSNIKLKSKDNNYLYNLIDEITSKNTAKKILGELILCFMYNPDNKLIIQQIAKVLEKIKKVHQAERIYRYICEYEDKKDRWEKYIIFSDRNNLYMNRIYGYISLIKFGEFDNEFKKQVKFLIKKNIFRITRSDERDKIIKKIIARYSLYEDVINEKGEEEFVTLVNSFIKGLMGEVKKSYGLISKYLNQTEKIHCLNFTLFKNDLELGKKILDSLEAETKNKHKDICNLYSSICTGEYNSYKGLFFLLNSYPLAPSIKDAKELYKYYFNNDRITEGIESFRKAIEIFPSDIPLRVEYSRLTENAGLIKDSFCEKFKITKESKTMEEYLYSNKDLILFSFYYGLEDEVESLNIELNEFINKMDKTKLKRKDEIKINNLKEMYIRLKFLKSKLDNNLFKNIVYSIRYRNLILSINVLEEVTDHKETIFNLLYLELYTDFKVGIIKRYLAYYRENVYEDSNLRKNLLGCDKELYYLLEELSINLKNKIMKPSIIENKLYIVTSDAGLTEDIKNVLKAGFDEYSRFIIKFYCAIRNNKNVCEIVRKSLKDISLQLDERIEIFEWLDTIYEDKRFFKVLGDWNFNIKNWEKVLYYYNKSELQGDKNKERLSNKYIATILYTWDLNRVLYEEYTFDVIYKAIVKIVKLQDYDEYRTNIYRLYLKGNCCRELILMWVMCFRCTKRFNEAFECSKYIYKINESEFLFLIKKLRKKVEEVDKENNFELVQEINANINGIKKGENIDINIKYNLKLHDLISFEKLNNEIIDERINKG